MASAALEREEHISEDSTVLVLSISQWAHYLSLHRRWIMNIHSITNSSVPCLCQEQCHKPKAVLNWRSAIRTDFVHADVQIMSILKLRRVTVYSCFVFLLWLLYELLLIWFQKCTDCLFISVLENCHQGSVNIHMSSPEMHSLDFKTANKQMFHRR